MRRYGVLAVGTLLCGIMFVARIIAEPTLLSTIAAPLAVGLSVWGAIMAWQFFRVREDREEARAAIHREWDRQAKELISAASRDQGTLPWPLTETWLAQQVGRLEPVDYTSDIQRQLNEIEWEVFGGPPKTLLRSGGPIPRPVEQRRRRPSEVERDIEEVWHRAHGV